MRYSVLYEKGRREKNQDSLVLQRMKTRDGDVILAAVCDGLGGEERGEVASGMIAEELVRWFCEELPELLAAKKGRRDLERSLSRALFHVHEALKRYGAERGLRLGTTMTMLLLFGANCFLAQIGDSMAYRITPGVFFRFFERAGCGNGSRCRPLTVSHGRNASVERCLGIGRYRAPDFSRRKRKRGEAYLLTSDGLLHGIGCAEFARVLSPHGMMDEETAARGLRTLCRTAEGRGSTDNMSAVYLWE